MLLFEAFGNFWGLFGTFLKLFETLRTFWYFWKLLETFETFGRLESHLLSVNPLRHVSLHRVPDLQIKF